MGRLLHGPEQKSSFLFKTVLQRRGRLGFLRPRRVSRRSITISREREIFGAEERRANGRKLEEIRGVIKSGAIDKRIG